MPIALKRVYEKPTRADGTRVLVDRLWPRGISKSEAALHAWLRELAPSDELRQWFHKRPEGWPAFRKRYLKELNNTDSADALDENARVRHQGFNGGGSLPNRSSARPDTKGTELPAMPRGARATHFLSAAVFLFVIFAHSGKIDSK